MQAGDIEETLLSSVPTISGVSHHEDHDTNIMGAHLLTARPLLLPPLHATLQLEKLVLQRGGCDPDAAKYSEVLQESKTRRVSEQLRSSTPGTGAAPQSHG